MISGFQFYLAEWNKNLIIEMSGPYPERQVHDETQIRGFDAITTTTRPSTPSRPHRAAVRQALHARGRPLTQDTVLVAEDQPVSGHPTFDRWPIPCLEEFFRGSNPSASSGRALRRTGTPRPAYRTRTPGWRCSRAAPGRRAPLPDAGRGHGAGTAGYLPAMTAAFRA